MEVKKNQISGKRIRNPNKHHKMINRLNREKGLEYQNIVLGNRIAKPSQRKHSLQQFANAESHVILQRMKTHKNKCSSNFTHCSRGPRTWNFCKVILKFLNAKFEESQKIEKNIQREKCVQQFFFKKVSQIN